MTQPAFVSQANLPDWGDESAEIRAVSSGLLEWSVPDEHFEGCSLPPSLATLSLIMAGWLQQYFANVKHFRENRRSQLSFRVRNAQAFTKICVVIRVTVI